MMIQLALQSVEGAKEILALKEVTIIGVLMLINVALATTVVYLYKRNEKQAELRLTEQKEFTKDLLNITEKTTNTVKQVNEILKITQKNV